MNFNNKLDGFDIDWFLIDMNSNIAVFSAGGGFMPNFIESNVEVHLSFTEYIHDFKGLSNGFHINPELESFVNMNEIFPLNGKSKVDTYISYFSKLSSKGLYSFDKTDLENLDDDRYHLVTSPIKKLKAEELPNDFGNLIPRINTLSFEFLEFINVGSLTL